MDADARALFERSISAATAKHTGVALDAALVDLGWRDALGDDPRAAVSILFEQQGAANAMSGSLDVVAGAVLPALGQWRAPARRDGDRVVVDGLALAPHDRMLVV